MFEDIKSSTNLIILSEALEIIYSFLSSKNDLFKILVIKLL